MPIPPTLSDLRLAIIGPGLLGGSLALATRRALPGASIRIWARREDAVADIRERGVADLASTELSDVVENANLIILATPVEVMPTLATLLTGLDLAEGVVVTDVGSVKDSVVRHLEPAFSKSPAEFLGSHPMAGSEQAGIDAAREDLFDGAVCILTPTPASSTAAQQLCTDYWQALGCRCLEMSAEDHDRKVARISHLPHFMAAVTTLAALQQDPSARDCSGSGFRDSTRIASGDPDLWVGIARQNREAVLAALRDAQQQLGDLVEILQSMDDDKLHRFLAAAKTLRD